MKPWFFAAGIETLITLLVLVALSALSSLLKRRQGRDEEELPAPPPVPRRGSQPQDPAPQPRGSSWEEELRRLLEGEAPKPAPPPVVVYERPPAPPPLPRPAPRPVTGRRAPAYDVRQDEGRGLAVDMPEFTEAAAARERVDQLDERVEERLRGGSSFTAANAAFEQARQLHKLAADRLRQVREQTPSFMAVAKSSRHDSEGARVVGLIRDPQTVRSVIVASLIFGPAKGLDH